ncbi:DNA-deoxyinosine glycosylase [Chitinasiproducens palmae]|uniref:Hypoxanthine-DNA glycosylase n=1 Tax=Chitinasiproducens palmae TaxID=1770053 RepID=A0A1H2PUR0_9BURK|nr:DNA-deoxyinosine glycosylase [Chitinasiproducens palmae]SDV50937.1 hypoxanthine-DNA glycosylase [Chitinasiproducens palmae]
MLSSFPPVADRDTRVMIFGSFPGVASLAATQYYAHPRNHFWRLLEAVLDVPGLAGRSYDDRLACLLAHRIGLWDVFAACEREGSLDSAIRQAQSNAFEALREHAPALEKACFNGKTAGRAAPLLAEAGYRTLVLPSSSPANAMLSFPQKLSAWRLLLE